MNLQKLLSRNKFFLIQTCGMKHFAPPPNYDHIKMPERPKLRFIDKVPFYPPHVRPIKMQKRLRLMRGPEEVHNFLQYGQYGIIALGGGRMKWSHFEMIRMAIARKIDATRMFAVWGIDPPWQPVTKKGQGQRMGGGKGAIDHYVTPVKTGRVIMELGGKCEFEEVEGILHNIAMKLPFQAKAVSVETLKEMKDKEKWEQDNNRNSYTMKYMMQNNIGGCHKWMSKFDFKFLGQYL